MSVAGCFSGDSISCQGGKDAKKTFSLAGSKEARSDIRRLRALAGRRPAHRVETDPHAAGKPCGEEDREFDGRIFPGDTV
jgi:hypothetical protein